MIFYLDIKEIKMAKLIRKAKKRDDACKINKIEITYFCGYLEKEFTKEIDVYDISATNDPCEMCGSHGSVSIEINECDCGHYHEIDIQSW